MYKKREPPESDVDTTPKIPDWKGQELSVPHPPKSYP